MPVTQREQFWRASLAILLRILVILSQISAADPDP